jgi:hypothetical protein
MFGSERGCVVMHAARLTLTCGKSWLRHRVCSYLAFTGVMSQGWKTLD